MHHPKRGPMLLRLALLKKPRAMRVHIREQPLHGAAVRKPQYRSVFESSASVYLARPVTHCYLSSQRLHFFFETFHSRLVSRWAALFEGAQGTRVPRRESPLPFAAGCPYEDWPYRDTSLIRNRLPLGPYSRTMSRDIWWPQGGGGFL